MKKTREEHARIIENDLKKFAGVVGNMITEGHKFKDINGHERVEYWLNIVEEYAKENDL
jgi:hypothetical protein